MDQNTQPDLSILLLESAAFITADEVQNLISGVVAAPGYDGGNGPTNTWMTMVAENPSKALVQCLDTLLIAARESEETGLTPHCRSEERVALLRQKLTNEDLDGFFIPVADEHQGEYVPKRAQRLAWLTGFTGSAGVAVVLQDRAAIFVDGRYTLQASNQVDEGLFEIINLADKSLNTWITSIATPGSSLGYDPWLHTVNEVRRLKVAAEKSRVKMVAVETNVIDSIWHNQPDPPLSPIETQEIRFAGQSSSRKRLAIAKRLRSAGQDAVVLTALDSIAWLANLRGGDVPYTPFTLAFGILHSDNRLVLYIDLRKVRPAVAQKLKDDVSLHPVGEFTMALNNLGQQSANVRIDPASAAEAIHFCLKEAGATIAFGDDPCTLPKSLKNNIELEGVRAAHCRDGLALTRFLAWLSKEVLRNDVTEISASQRLETFRREGAFIRGLSFPTISGAGPNGAIIHYRVTAESNRSLEMNSLYLVDSGAQYLDGTTDVTRTVAIGTPSDEMRDRFTRVLKGHIALATAAFPEGTTGSQLDVLARAPLWQAGLDYDHGTGHGVGHYLGVHEGPHRISKITSRVALKPGMIVSNEPGYYKYGAYGIRIESLLVIKTIDKQENSEHQMLGFETLTLVPIDLALLERQLLTDHEAAWLNDYHSKVFMTHSGLLNVTDREWLEQSTRPI